MNKKRALLFLIGIAVFSNCKKENTIIINSAQQNITEQIAQSKTDSQFEYILYDNLSTEIIKPISEHLSAQINRIGSDLKVDVSKIKYKIRIWDNKTAYLDYQKQISGVSYPASGGYILSTTELAILYSPQAKDIAEHELGHAISLQVNSNFGNNPRWLWESVAIYESGEFYDPQKIDYLKKGDFPSIDELSSDVNNGNQKIYSVGYLLSEFIIKQWGNEKYIELIKNNGDIKITLNVSVADFEKKWKDFVVNKYF